MILLNAVCMKLFAVGEEVKALDKRTDKTLLPKYPQIQWKDVMGMRDVIAHHYFELEADKVWFAFQMIAEAYHSDVYKINIRYIIVATAFSIICIFLYYQFKIVIKEERTEQKSHKNSIRLGVAVGITFWFLSTINAVYLAWSLRPNITIISWNEYIERLPLFVIICSIIGLFCYFNDYIFSQLEKHNNEEKLKQKKTENNITEFSQVNETIK